MAHPGNDLHAIFLMSADISYRASKVRGTVLPQEYTLSRFVSNLTTRQTSWKETTPACEWRYVVCNEEKQVISLQWENTMFEGDIFDDDYIPDYPALAGELLWEYMPCALISFTAYLQDLVGPVQLSVLPNSLKKFDICMNKCTGLLDLVHLPSTLEYLDLSFNQFEGEIDLTQLPGCLKHLDLSSNYLCGSLDLTLVPENVHKFVLSKNYFAKPHVVPKNVEFGDQKDDE